MFVSRIEIKNVRCFEEITLDLSSGINLLVGANNSGKSSVIKTIYTLNASSTNILNINDIRNNCQYSRYFITLKDINQEYQEKFGFQEFDILNEILDERTVYRNLTKKGTNEFFQFDKRIFKREENHWNMDLGNDLQKHLFTGFNSREDENNFVFPFFAKRKTNGLNSTSYGKDETFSVRDTLYNLTGKIKKITNSSHPYSERFRVLCDEILGFSVGIIPKNQNGNSEEQIGIYLNSVDTIPIESMGEGVISIIGLITYLLADDGKLYLIEELENDIHPRALKSLLELIIEKSNKNQFVISTHSNIVLKHLASVETSKIFKTEWYIKKDPLRKSSIPTSTVIEIRNDSHNRIKILTDLGYDFFDFELYEAYLFLEESSAESIINKILIPWFVPELKSRLRTISCGGIYEVQPKLISFKRHFTFIHLSEIYKDRTWVIVDGDAPGKDIINKLKADHENWRSDRFYNLNYDNFEKYYPKNFKLKINEVISNKKNRELKIELLREVLEWSRMNEEMAKIEFQESANEVIEKLKEISNQLEILNH